MFNTQQAYEKLLQLARGGVKLPVMMWGAPGIGKTSIVHRVGDEIGIPVVDIRLSQLGPTDLRGLPVPEDGVARWYPPSFLPSKGKGIIFLDEINLAPPVMQGMAQQLIHERRLGDYTVPEGWMIWAAGNRQEDRASVFTMPAPLANRFLHFHVQMAAGDAEVWATWAAQNGIHPDIVGYIMGRPSMLCQAPKDTMAFPSPRSWAAASTLLNAGMSAADIACAVGDGAASDFAGFQRMVTKMPNLAKILAGKSTDSIDRNDPSMCYALSTSVALSSTNAAQLANGLEYVIKQASDEYALVCVKLALSADWLAKNRAALVEFNKLIAARPALTELMTRVSKLYNALSLSK